MKQNHNESALSHLELRVEGVLAVHDGRALAPPLDLQGRGNDLSDLAVRKRTSEK